MAKKIGASLTQAMPKATKMDATSEPEDPMKDYESKDHLETLIKAHGIMNDPKKMAKVNALAGRHHKAIVGIKKIKSIGDIKQAYQDHLKQLQNPASTDEPDEDDAPTS